MGRIGETVRTVNSTLRTLLFALLLAGASFAGWKGYSFYNEPQLKLAEKQSELDSLQKELEKSEKDLSAIAAELKEKEQKVQRLTTSMRLLRLNHRIARLHVVEQVKQPDSDRLLTTIEFFEVNDDGAPVDEKRRSFQIEGDRVYVECLVVKFEDKYVEKADLDRATAICMFQRIFGMYQEPKDGFPLDEVGTSPTAYARGGKMSEFEQSIWTDFWIIAGDRKKAAEIGIRAAHAVAPSTQVRKGVTYELQLRSTGEFSLLPIATNSL